LDPDRQHIFVANTDRLRAAEQRPGVIAVWNYSDNGDVPPKAIITGPDSGLIRPRGLAINPKHGEVYVVDMVKNALLMFSWPEVFGSFPQSAADAAREGKP